MADRFHLQRRMFITYHGFPMLAPAEMPLSHKEWMEEEGQTLGDETRGYLLNNELFFYRGEDFRADFQVLKDIVTALPHLIIALDLNRGTRVWFGVIPGRKGVQWKGKVLLGTVGELITEQEILLSAIRGKT
jgi:hypothetical protein